MEFYNLILGKKSNYKNDKPIKTKKLKNVVYKHKKDRNKYAILNPNNDNNNSNENGNDILKKSSVMSSTISPSYTKVLS